MERKRLPDSGVRQRQKEDQMTNGSFRRSFAWAAALVLAGSLATAAQAATERPECPANQDLSLTILLKGNPGGR